jgi:hypothetical protein
MVYAQILTAIAALATKRGDDVENIIAGLRGVIEGLGLDKLGINPIIDTMTAVADIIGGDDAEVLAYRTIRHARDLIRSGRPADWELFDSMSAMNWAAGVHEDRIVERVEDMLDRW